MSRPHGGSPRRRSFMAACSALLLVLDGGLPVHASAPRLFVVQYALVSTTETPLGPEYVFRGRLLNLGPPVAGAVARLTGASEAATVLDDTLTFGSVDRFGLAWSTDTAAIRRHGRWRDIVTDLRWVIDLTGANRAPTAAAGPDQAVAIGEHVVLDGSASVDPDGDPLSYRWSFVSRPAASAAALDDPAAVRPAFDIDAPGRYVVGLIVNDGRVSSPEDLVEVTTSNSGPNADAGPDQRVVTGAVAQLDGSASSDPDGDRLVYRWQFVQRPIGSLAQLDDPSAVRPTFVVDVAGSFIVALIVSDGLLSSAPDTVMLTTADTAPTADAGPDQRAALGASVTLDGSASTDVDGDALTHAWALVSKPIGSTATLSATDVVRPRFTVDLSGQYVAQLIVNDGQVDSAPDTVVVSTINTRPVADAGRDATVAPGQTVVIDGSASHDADGDPLMFQWTLSVAPPGSTARVQDPGAAVTTFVADRPGDYVLQLVVNDGQLDSAPDGLVVSTVNSAPVADAGPDVDAAPLGAVVVLDGTASSDPDGHALRYAWALLTRPSQSTATLRDDDTAAPSFVPDEPGTYVAQLIVNDGLVDSAPDTVRISTVNAPPIADAGRDDTVPWGTTVTLDGGASSDPEGAPLGFQWTLVTTPAGSGAALSNGTTATPSFLADTPGQFTVQLVVDDGAQASAPDLVVITVTAPIVSAAATDAQAAERGPDPGAFTLSRSGPLTLPLDVEFALQGRATPGVDFDAVPLIATIPPGTADLVVAVTPLADTDAEGDETVILNLVARPPYTLGAAASATVVIADDPTPVVTVVATDPDAAESGDIATFTVTRTGATTTALDVALAVTAASTATAGVDYPPLPAVVTLPAGASSIAVPLVPIDDVVYEPVESVVVTVAAAAGYLVGTPSLAVTTIADDDTLVSVLATDPTTSEPGVDTATVTVTRLGDTSGPLTVGYTLSGTATPSIDFVALPGQVTFAAGASDAAITVQPIDDALLEGPETIVLTALPGAGYHLSAVRQATVTLLDDERPVVTLTVADDVAGEAGPDPGAFAVARTGPTTLPLTVDMAVTGAATEGVDYQPVGRQVTIPAGAAAALVTVVPIDDTLVEGAENVVVTVATGPDYVVGVPGIAALTIADDDLGVVTIEATDPSASERGLDPGLITLRRTGAIGSPLTVRIDRTGTATTLDYAPIAVLVTIPAGSATLTLTVAPRPDNLVEGDEDVTLVVQAGPPYVVGSPASATVTITDDPAVVTLIAASPAAAEAGLVAGGFELTRLGGDLAAALSVAVTVGGTTQPNRDYVVVSGVVTFPAGLTTTSVPIVPLADNLVEPDETVVMTLAAGTGTTYLVGSPALATVTISDDPPIVELVALDPDVAEAGLDPGAVQVRRTGGDVTSALNVFYRKSGTASAGTDYQGGGGAVNLVTIPAGQTTTTIAVVPVADNLVEGAETAVLTLEPSQGYLAGASTAATIVIADDPPVVDIVASTPDALEGGGSPGIFTVTRRGGNLSQALTVTVARTGTATPGIDDVTFALGLTFAGGQSTATIAVTPIDDAVIEGDETVVLTVVGSGSVVPGGSATATVVIRDDD